MTRSERAKMKRLTANLKALSGAAHWVLANDIEDWEACLTRGDGGGPQCRRKRKLADAIRSADKELAKP